MNDLNQHYEKLLGLDESWAVEDVELDLEVNSVSIRLGHCGGKLVCPECGGHCFKADTCPERCWRHLDTMQFETRIYAAVPRSKCSQCGVKTVAVPWAGKHSRFTLMFEAFAIRVLQAAANVKKAAELLNLSWNSAHQIMSRAVDRGIEQREEEPIEHIGIDEKSFGSGQDYISVMVDIDRSRVLEVAAERSEESCDQLWNSLSNGQKASVQSVSTDFWQAFLNSIKKHVPQAEVVHDRFHISQYLVEAVDLVRRKENRVLLEDGMSLLKGTRQLWLYNCEKLDKEENQLIKQAQRASLKTARAWALKEHFRYFWEYDKAGWAKRFFDHWYGWAIRSRLDPIKKVATMLKKHLHGLLSYFRHRVTNAVNEGFNSRIQAIKSSARGFRSFENYRIRILFYCGKLNLMPHTSHKNQ